MKVNKQISTTFVIELTPREAEILRTLVGGIGDSDVRRFRGDRDPNGIYSNRADVEEWRAVTSDIYEMLATEGVESLYVRGGM